MIRTMSIQHFYSKLTLGRKTIGKGAVILLFGNRNGSRIFKTIAALTVAAGILLSGNLSGGLLTLPAQAAVVNSNDSAPAVTREIKKIAAGTKYETPLYIIKSKNPGPVFLISGGVHGNEPAGYKTAAQYTNINIKRGTLLIIPEANKLAVQAFRRYVSSGDLNRQFPKSISDKPDSYLASQLFQVIKDYRVQYHVDMHEGYDYHVQNSASVGQSIIYYPKGNSAAWSQELVAKLNKTVPYSKRFSVLKYPISGSFARASGIQGVQSFIFETSTKQTLSTRISQQKMMLDFFLDKLNMK